MEALETKDTQDSVERFAELMVLERVDPVDLKKYLKKIMKHISEKGWKK